MILCGWCRCLLLFFFLSCPLLVHAEFEDTSRLLLRDTASEAKPTDPVASGRYKVTPLPPKKVKSVTPNTPSVVPPVLNKVPPLRSDITLKVFEPSVKTLPPPSAVKTEKLPHLKTELESVKPVQPNEISLPAQFLEEPQVVSVPEVTEQVKEIVLGNPLPQVEAYKEQIHWDDVRLNQIEINVVPGVLSNKSRSDYSYRDYSTFSPSVRLGAQFWMTPFMGIYGQYLTTFGGDVASGTNGRDRIFAQHEISEVGFDLRRFFGMSRRAISFAYGLHIFEYKFTVPSDSTDRVNTKSTGIGLHIQARFPVHPNYSWTFGGNFIPRIQHSEASTGIGLSSGSAGESARAEAMIGGEFKMRRQNQIIWNLKGALEKDHFTGQANRPDPQTGTTPRGVSVENMITLFELGYRWGQ